MELSKLNYRILTIEDKVYQQSVKCPSCLSILRPPVGELRFKCPCGKTLARDNRVIENQDTILFGIQVAMNLIQKHHDKNIIEQKTVYETMKDSDQKIIKEVYSIVKDSQDRIYRTSVKFNSDNTYDITFNEIRERI
jgi:predicted RNA-binding Zn-ribbon protein involved in translation (DUF1610 family)